MMRRMLLVFVSLALVTPVSAQIGKRVSIRAGTPEDKVLLAINAATDEAEKLKLIDEFLAEFGQSDLALVGYELYMAHYLQSKEYDKVYEYGEKALEVDPDGFQTAVTLLRTAQEQGNVARLFDYGEKVGGILQRYKARPAPEGTPEESWKNIQRETIADNQDNITYVEYALFSTAYQNQDAAVRAAQLERFAWAFPDSGYASTAQTIVAATYQQMQQYDRMLGFASKVLAADPNNYGMLVLLADHWSERREELPKAEEYAGRAIQALQTAAKPALLTDEQWEQQKSLQQGLAHSALGQVHIILNRNAQAVDAFNAAAPLLKPNAFMYARNQYRLGFAYINLKRMDEARQAFTDAASVDSPYRGPSQDKLKTLPAKAPAKRRRP